MSPSLLLHAMYRRQTEASLVAHLLWLRELLRIGALRELQWIDTRDMLADALTKGTIDRKALYHAMNGYMHYAHDCLRHHAAHHVLQI